MSMRDYVQKTRHLASCIVTKPFYMASPSLTRAEPDSLEKAFALALREDYVVTSSYARGMSAADRADVPEPMEIDAIEASNSRNGSSSSANRGAGSSRGRVPRAGSGCCERRSSRRTNPGRSLKKRPGPVGAGRPTGGNGSPGPPLPLLHAPSNVTTANGDTRLIILSLHVAGARRPLRALLDSGASNNFFLASCLSILPDSVHVRSGPDEVVVKLADATPCLATRLSLPYTFDGFRSVDDFPVIEMNYAFDCILGIPWLARYQPEVDWLARSVKRRSGFDVSEVFTHLLVAPRDWPHVTIVARRPRRKRCTE
ncbi:LOW QUALITY PROTEIN: polyprotein, partial [Phytophthora megakarya]